MRITSITLRNCRLHRELKVDFDPARTLIGGPNETGKSTLIEAMHRALFLKAKGNTEYHRALISALHSGHPEVDLAFEAGGQQYLLKKRFGTNGTTSLAPANSVLVSGDAAESELARLLGVEAGIAGRALPVQWAHLWVWQGQAGDDPSTHATAQQSGLLQRLQQMGGAAALQSELDARVAKHFVDAKNLIYTQADKPKAGSELDRADRANALAQEKLNLASDRVRKLDTAAADLESASRTLVATSASLVILEDQQKTIEARAQKLGELRQQETEQAHAATAAATRHSALDAANHQILKTRKDISELAEILKPQTEAIDQLEKTSNAAKSHAATAEADYRAATEAVRAARLRYDLACASLSQFEKIETHAKLSDKEKKVSNCRLKLAGLKGQLAQLPKVDKSKLTKIQKLESEYSIAGSALRAMATGVEVVATDQLVRAGEQSLAIGQRQILTEDTEVQIGSSIQLRIQPGGGTSLATARQTQADTLKELRAALDSLSLQSVKEAAEAYAGREELGSRIKTAEAELDGMGAEALAEELQTALNDLTAANAVVERLAVVAPEVAAPDDKTAAKALAKTWEEKLKDAGDQETAAKNIRDGAVNSLESAEKLLNEKRAEIEQQRLQLTRLHGQQELLLKTHGDDEARSRALLECQAAKDAAQKLLQATKDAMGTLQPDLLESDRTRIARAIKEKTNEQNDAGKQIAVAKAALNSDGSEDPAAELATAEAKSRSAREYLGSVQRRSQAIVLLDQMFKEEQRNLAERFTQPLADKISGYLQCIFGAGVRAQVDLENNEFTSLRLSRPGSGGAPFAFDALSGGAKEQTAAAVRLAMAEVLAADYGGCLPVVFDDAFAYSDPERVNQLQRMLDLAATRGLQVIVLTCNPADYASLGAKTILLRPG